MRSSRAIQLMAAAAENSWLLRSHLCRQRCRAAGCGATAATKHTKDQGGAARAPNGPYRITVAAAEILTEVATCAR